MLPTKQGSIRLFRIAGIDVYLHWSWFLVAAYEIQAQKGDYSSLIWNALEYLALFVIVTMHEFGHALACRQVGGQANQIVLWPLGGVAYVDPPPRPGAMLWSIAAGPLVNVGLLFVLTPIWLMSRAAAWPEAMPNLYTLLFHVWAINLLILGFNLLPIYPLDGGQILRFCRSSRSSLEGHANAFLVDRANGGFHSNELHQRLEDGTGYEAIGECAAPSRVCLSVLQGRAAGG
jgi:Zn-dependent protease